MALTPPVHVDARRLAIQGGRLEYVLSPAQLTRVAAAYRVRQDVVAELRFGLDEQGYVRIRGRIRAPALTADCQRCLEQMEIAVDTAVDYVIDAEEEDAETGASAARNDGTVFDVMALIEDELMLACPMIATHSSGACAAPGGRQDGEHTGHPFDVLRGLRENNSA